MFVVDIYLKSKMSPNRIAISVEPRLYLFCFAEAS